MSSNICPECNQEWNGWWCKPCNSKRLQNDFNNWTSGNDKIDKFIQDAQLNADVNWEAIEWIPYDRFKDVKQIGKGGFGTIHYARWIDGIREWDIENQHWKRWDGEVALKKFDNFVNFNNVLNEMEIHFKTHAGSYGSSSIRFYGITQDPETHSYMMVLYYAKDGNLREYLKVNFNNINWNQKLNDLWYLSLNLMNIHKLNIFDNFVNFNNVLNEMEIHFKTHAGSYGSSSIRFYGITQDPETHSYMMVLYYAKDGNLREYLKVNFNNINWNQKLNDLWYLSLNLMNIHKLNIVHQDFHPGNILSSNFKNDIKISDFGLSKLIGVNPNNPEKKNVFGVLPYIAPEVLSGDEEYTKAADVYSYGIIAYEMITGFPPYPDIPHDEDLAIKICNGLRPKIPFHTPKLITRTIMRCWDARVTHRPTFEELEDEFHKYLIDYYNNKDSEIVIQIKKAEEFSANQESTNITTTTTTTPLNYKTHPLAIYTSRLLNYSNLSKPKNEENFERELEELTKSFSHITTNDDIDEF
ncbi:hypothetical protein Glove_633g8 [Diversispora epigaea]|uniref:Protein kinase domain-containing protein n=1 Tax=Diversispora epigaea TaxID=1348612 RepID=A0A397G8D2_9GLOM|nr:hypothetical protein Glove_633g8 [Diversispora epigaea]